MILELTTRDSNGTKSKDKVQIERMVGLSNGRIMVYTHDRDFSKTFRYVPADGGYHYAYLIDGDIVIIYELSCADHSVKELINWRVYND